MRRVPRIWLLLLPLTADCEIQTQHAFDTSADLGRLQTLWHFRVRTKPEGGGLFQARMGPIFEFDVTKRVTLIAGYYFTREQDQSWTTTNRPFAGGEFSMWERGIEADWRTLLERFIVVGEPDYFRFRNRFRFSPARATAPYVSVEVFVDAKGLRSTRYSAGVRRTFSDDFIVDVGYFFEDRRPMPGGERHMFSTSFHWRNKTRRIDPEF
jgi:uncharacterized protein DUF2490